MRQISRDEPLGVLEDGVYVIEVRDTYIHLYRTDEPDCPKVGQAKPADRKPAAKK